MCHIFIEIFVTYIMSQDIELNILDNTIADLESKLVSLPMYDFKYIFEVLTAINKSETVNELSKIKAHNIKILVAMEIGSKISQTNLKDKNINFNFELNKIDEHLGPTVRSRLVRNMVSNNIKIDIEGIPTPKQIEDCLGSFFELISNEQLNKFPTEWEIYYWLFYIFRDQLKPLIVKCSQNIASTNSRETITHIRVVKGYEDRIKEILESNSSSFIIKSEDSIINGYDMCLLTFLSELKVDFINKCSELNNSFKINEYITPDQKTEPYQLAISPFTEELFIFLNKRLSQCSTLSTGNAYYTSIINATNVIKDHMTEVGKKYFYEKDKAKSYNPSIEFVLLNIICTSEASMKILEELRIKVSSSIQNKYKKNVNDCIDTTRNVIASVFTESINFLVLETIKRYQQNIDQLKTFNFSEKMASTTDNMNKSRVAIADYIKSVTSKYVNTLIRINGFINSYCVNEISKKLTFDTIDCVFNHLLSLSGIHCTHSDNFDIIVETLMKRTSNLMGDVVEVDVIENQRQIKKVINGDLQIGVMQDGTTITVRLKISTKITKIRELINAIAVKNQDYTEEKHNSIFGENSKIRYETVNIVKGNLNYKNAPRVAIVAIGDTVGTVTKPVTNLTTVGVNGLTRMVGLDSSNHSDKEIVKDKKNDDIDFPTFSAMVSDAKKMFLIGGKKDQKQKSTIS